MQTEVARVRGASASRVRGGRQDFRPDLGRLTFGMVQERPLFYYVYRVSLTVPPSRITDLEGLGADVRGFSSRGVNRAGAGKQQHAAERDA